MRLIPGLIGAAFVLTAAPGLAAEGGADPPIRLALPVACQMGRTCFIQQYFDHDPGPGAKDYRCGVMTYDGHDGVDIRGYLPWTLIDNYEWAEGYAANFGLTSLDKKTMRLVIQPSGEWFQKFVKANPAP